ncbi:hypothetical protein HY486_00530 [Candidatus Woesearchaeota archaeon]|nr:hypothetical protein [Candidatus Woesearchaeota archaeon]
MSYVLLLIPEKSLRDRIWAESGRPRIFNPHIPIIEVNGNFSIVHATTAALADTIDQLKVTLNPDAADKKIRAESLAALCETTHEAMYTITKQVFSGELKRDYGQKGTCVAPENGWCAEFIAKVLYLFEVEKGEYSLRASFPLKNLINS